MIMDPLVNVDKKLWNITMLLMGKIAMLVYQRVVFHATIHHFIKAATGPTD